MQEVLQWIVNFFILYGYRGIFILTVILLTQILKTPIKKAAQAYAEKNGIDKKVITWVIMLIPLVLTFVWVLLLALYTNAWKFPGLPWAEIAEETGVYAAITSGVFETGKNTLQAIAAGKEAKVAIAAKTASVAEEDKIV